MAALLVCGFTSVVATADPPIIESVEPAQYVQGTVPQPEILVHGQNLIEGLPDEKNRPTVTFRQKGGGVEFTTLAFVDIGGTTAFIPPEDVNFNLLNAPIGAYDVTVTQLDGESDTLEGGFSVVPDEPEPGAITLVTRGAWGGSVNGVDVIDDVAYLAVGRRLVTLNISEPSDPIELGSIFLPTGADGVRVRDGFAFVASSRPYRFSVIDVSDPSSLSLVSVSYIPTLDYPKDIVLYGDLAYARGANGDIDVYNISEPESVVFLADVNVTEAEAMAIAGDLLFLGADTRDAELWIYDLADDPLNPELIGTVASSGTSTSAISAEGNYATWTVGTDDSTCLLCVVDVSEPTEPFVVGIYEETSGTAFADVKFVNGMAYVANTALSPDSWSLAKGLLIFDILTDPTTPTLVGKLKTHGDVQGVEVFGTTAYVMDEGEGMIVVDVSDPTDPVRLGGYHSPGSLRKAWKSGDLLYVSDTWNGFTILDVADATRPEVLGVYAVEHIDNMGIDTWGITVQDDRAYLGAGHMGLEVVDVSNPQAPALLGAYRIPEPANPARSVITGVTVSGDVAHVGLTECVGDVFAICTGYFVNLDVSDPQNIEELGREKLDSGTGPMEIALNADGIAFLAAGEDASSTEVLIVDTSDLEHPETIHSGITRPASDVALEDSILYVADGDDFGDSWAGLLIADVSNPESPEVIAIIDGETPFVLEGVETFEEGRAVAVQDGHLYAVALGNITGSGLIHSTFLFDVTDPASPTLLAVAPRVGGSGFGASSTELYVEEPFVYVVDAAPNAGTNEAAGLVIVEVVGLGPLADLDGDGVVGTADLLILLGAWGQCPPKSDCPADLDDNGLVGTSDLLILLGSWGS